MPLVSIDKSREDLLLNLHQDMLINNFSVHDETIQIVDKKLAEPIMEQLVKISELSKVFSQIDIPFIQFKFDVEYDKWGSYTASDAIDVYKYNYDRIKNKLGNNFSNESTISPKLKVQQHQPVDEYEDVPINDEPLVFEYKIKKYSEEVVDKINNLPDGEDIFVLYIDDAPFTYNRAVDSSKF